MPSAAETPETPPSRLVPRRVQWGVWGIVTLAAVCCELVRWLDEESRAEALTGWLAGVQPDWLPFLPWLALTPLVWWGFRTRPGAVHSPAPRFPLSPCQSAWCGALLVFSVAFIMSWRTGTAFNGLPPAYHDEYSYLFQARTYLAGRLSFASFAAWPELFDQMHVLNEGRFASRYFPGVGLWLAPFVALGNPWLGYQLAQALSAMLVYWTGRELSNTGVGLLAGLLFAVSPGLVLFSNLLLAHHATLLGLTLFLWAFVTWLRTGSVVLLTIAGSGLAFAMICRPMTAAGFGLPFGTAFAATWLRGMCGEPARTAAQRPRLLAGVTALAAPLAIGMLFVMFCNWRITGAPLTSPYQLYTDIYTPRHVYGFNNVERGERRLGPKVLDNYDRWAENLTPSLAIRNVGHRLVNSGRWTLGIVPLALAGFVVLCTPRMGDPRWRLILAAIVSLHAVHVPYWFEGIMGWHYVFETAPLWLLVFAEGTRRLFVTWHVEGRRALPGWWLTLVVLGGCVNLLTVPPLWPGRLDRGVAEVAFPRRQYAEFRRRVDELRDGRPAVVFVLPDPSDRHVDFVTNPPDLSGPVLVARLPDRSRLSEATALFPDRIVLLFDAAGKRFLAVD